MNSYEPAPIPLGRPTRPMRPHELTYWPDEPCGWGMFRQWTHGARLTALWRETKPIPPFEAEDIKYLMDREARRN